MQGHRSVVGSSTGTIDFDHGAASSSAGIGEELFWSDQPLPDILPSSGSTGVPHYGSSGVGGHTLSLWSQGEGSSSSMQNAGGCSEQKLENGWPSGSLGSDTVTGFEEWFNTPTFSSQDNITPNMASSHVVNGQLTLRGSSTEASHHTQLNSSANASVQNINLNVRVSSQSDDHIQFVESSNSYRSGFSGSGQRPVSATTRSIVTPGNSSLLTADNVRRFDSSHDACQLPLKRKFIDQDIGQSSASGSARSYHHAEGSSWRPIPVDNSDNDSNIIPPHPHLQHVYGISPSGIVSGSMPDVSQVENGSSARNLRLRLNSADQHTAPILMGSPGSAFTLSVDSMQHPDATFPTSISFTQESANQQTHPTAHAVLPRNGHSFRRSRGSSSRSNSGVVIGEQSGMQNSEAILRMSRQMLERHMRAHQLIQVSRSRHLSSTRGSGSSSTAGSSIPPPDPNPSVVAASALNSELNSSANMPAGRTWGPGQNFASGQRMSEIVRRSVIAAGGTDQARSTNNQSLPLPGAPSSRQPISASANSQRNQLAHRRLALLMQRRASGLPGVPYSLQGLGAAGEDRSRLLSELWSALDSMRRGEPLRPEDMMILDQSGLFGMAAELHDRHRDMRLDVDNMSYEELLALEERIGNVNTGLTEEAVMKCLKQRKFSPTATTTTMTVTISGEETESCCICQEEYKEGEELGILDCGHNFHTVCVKQWLMVKNLCPICKTTGLASQ